MAFDGFTIAALVSEMDAKLTGGHIQKIAQPEADELLLSIKNNTYIEQARLGGANNFRIMTGYIIRNVMPSLLVNITQDIGSKLLTIAGLSLLGLGSQPPTPEWGYMLSEGKDYMYSAPWMLMAPGIVILINVIIFNLLGDSIQDLMNPKRKN